MSHVSKGSVGATDDAVDLADVSAVVGPDHDSVQGRRRTVKMHEQATFVAFRFNRARKHLKTCSILRPSAFGVVGITQALDGTSIIISRRNRGSHCGVLRFAPTLFRSE